MPLHHSLNGGGIKSTYPVRVEARERGVVSEEGASTCCIDSSRTSTTSCSPVRASVPAFTGNID